MTGHSLSVGAAPLHAAGFKTLTSELLLESVPTEGHFPDWLSGSLLRNGPAMFEAGDEPLNHHFDGYAMLHRFGFRNGAVSYRNRFLRSRSYEYVIEHRKLGYPVFGTRLDPDRARLLTEDLKRGGMPDVNAGVAFARFADQHVALTDGSTLAMAYDLETLETKGPIIWDDVLQREDCAGNEVEWFRRGTTAHCQLAPNGDIVNYFTQPGDAQRSTAYNFYRIRPGTLRREPIGVVQTDAPAYVHAFCVTEKYLVFPESPLRADVSVLRDGGSFLESLAWREGTPMILHVLEQATGRLVRRFEVRPSYVMHTINAYDEGDSIVLDVAAYDDGSHVAELYLNPELRREGGRLTHERVPELRSHARPVRFRLNLATGAATEEELAPVTVELPTIDYSRHNGRRYSRFYSTGISNDPEMIFYNQLASVDTESGRFTTWSQPGHFPGEPVFVRRPGGQREDDGILLSVVLDGTVGRSYVMALDPATLEPMAKAFLPHHMPCGFHGQFVSGEIA
ncbi:Apocarotenoid-15,15'-oxygenase [Paraburkholderia ultramafica]|uniref:Apocarotenoid-15,15'-oxygenase n=1 Tax=Paraburkholderia ultramafica TaxID=1544867 RepID=A0A6S7B4W0_9BURK|nr:carotenoid oxygenase family protein [Paraburkholderia ultramafica]CAB3779506.1 Apocarotenoid-15,15'-oxygenase [Paraburkholderia ultramafica]